jgi:hypothetical protein
LGDRDRWISDFEASLVYRVSSRTARAIERNPVSKSPPPKEKEKEKKRKKDMQCVIKKRKCCSNEMF